VVWLALATPVLVWAFLYRTRRGLVVRAVGESHDVAHALGCAVLRVRYAAVVFGGAMAGLAGAYLSLVYTPMWTENMVAGRGWIALALVVLAPEVEEMAEAPFHVGRALGVLVQRATVLERVSADDVAPLFACAAIAAGVPPPAGLPKPSEELLRTVMRGIGRKEKKALMLQASRFAFESFDLVAWHEGVLRTADRLGLMMAGDVAEAAQALAGGEAAAGDHPSAPAASVATSPAALDLVRYALSEQYAALRRSVDDAASARAGGKGPR